MFFVGGCFLSLSTAGHCRHALSTYAFNVASFQKEHQKALPIGVESYFSFILCFNKSLTMPLNVRAYLDK